MRLRQIVDHKSVVIVKIVGHNTIYAGQKSVPVRTLHDGNIMLVSAHRNGGKERGFPCIYAARNTNEPLDLHSCPRCTRWIRFAEKKFKAGCIARRPDIRTVLKHKRQPCVHIGMIARNGRDAKTDSDAFIHIPYLRRIDTDLIPFL